MFLNKLKRLAETLSLACFALLAVYGVVSLMRGDPVLASGNVPAPAQAPQSAPLMDWGGATVPLVLNYQGNLKDAEGNPLSGYYTMTFRIYADVAAIITNAVWSEQHISVTVRDGRFSVLLGNVYPLTNSIPAMLFDSPDRFVGVTIYPFDEMVPRQRFASVPYAVHANGATTATIAISATVAAYANNADRLDGQDADDLVPPGTVVAYAGTTPPAGWLLCDGSTLSRTQYARLFAAIGTAHGAGNTVTTFNLPDYRGRFLRGRDGGAGRDPDRATRAAVNTGGNTGDNVGSVQLDQIQTHKHIDSGHTHAYFRVYLYRPRQRS